MTSEPWHEPQQQQQYGDEFELLGGLESTITGTTDAGGDYNYPSCTTTTTLLDDVDVVVEPSRPEDDDQRGENWTEVRN